MAALTAASWTVTVTERWLYGTKRYSRGTMALAGTDTYPTGGVPMPAKEKFGMQRQLDSIKIMGQDSSVTHYAPTWDKTNAKLQMYVSHDTAAATTLPLDEEDSAGVPGPRTYLFEACGW